MAARRGKGLLGVRPSRGPSLRRKHVTRPQRGRGRSLSPGSQGHLREQDWGAGRQTPSVPSAACHVPAHASHSQPAQPPRERAFCWTDGETEAQGSGPSRRVLLPHHLEAASRVPLQSALAWNKQIGSRRAGCPVTTASPEERCLDFSGTTEARHRRVSVV